MVRTHAPVTGRRPEWIALALLVALLATVPVYAQEPAAAAKPVSNPRLFPNDGGMILNFIKPDKTADFEEVMTKLREALAKSDKPERKEQAAGWRVLKAADPAVAGANVLYVYFVYPSSKTADYQVSNIIAEAFPPAEANEILKKYAEAYAQGMNIVNLNVVQDFSK
jgi:hypothetical protein